jgi:hypothetical protein
MVLVHLLQQCEEMFGYIGLQLLQFYIYCIEPLEDLFDISFIHKSNMQQGLFLFTGPDGYFLDMELKKRQQNFAEKF